MRGCQQSASEKPSRFSLDTGLFFLLFYLYLWLIIDPRLIDHAVGILSPYYSLTFTAGWPFFQEHLMRPGGIIEYVARFLSQFFSWGWMGAMIVTAVASAMCWSVGALVRLAKKPAGLAIRLVPPVLLLMMYTDYSQPLTAVLSLLPVLMGFGLYVRLAPQGQAAWSIFVLAMCLALNYITGSASILFPVLLAIYEILIRRNRLAGVVGLLCGLMVPGLLGVSLSGSGFRDAYGAFLTPASGAALPDWPYLVVLYVYFPVVLAGAALRETRVFHNPRPTKRAASRAASPSRWARVLGFLRAEDSSRGMKTMAVLLTVAVILWFIRDPHGKTMLNIDYCCQHERWSDALDAAANLPPHRHNSYSNRNVMLALCRTGQIGEEMFRYPQFADAVDMHVSSRADGNVPTFLQMARFFTGIGEINRAERYACEALSETGDLPAILKQLAMINIVKDRPETAKVFLNALSKKPLHHQVAQEMLRKLGNDPRMEDDLTVSRLRAVMLKQDDVSYVVSVEVMLQRLLAQNRHNKMAFDFLMAHYLLTRRTDRVVANLQHLEDFGYQGIPRHFQEAVVAQASATDNWALTREYAIGPEILGQEVLLRQILANAANEHEAMNAAIDAGLDHSYLFFHKFGRSGF